MPLELREVPPEDELPAHVDQIRRWNRAYWLLLILGLPAAVFLGAVAALIVGAPWAFAIPLIAWIVAILVVQIRANTFLCPRCGEPIRPFSILQVPWDVRCPACDLSVSRRSDER